MGLAVDPAYSVFGAAYPFVLRRLLADPHPQARLDLAAKYRKSYILEKFRESAGTMPKRGTVLRYGPSPALGAPPLQSRTRAMPEKQTRAVI